MCLGLLQRSIQEAGRPGPNRIRAALPGLLQLAIAGYPTDEEIAPITDQFPSPGGAAQLNTVCCGSFRPQQQHRAGQ